jgi:hypothetical protein
MAVKIIRAFLGIAAPSDSDYWLGLHPVDRHEITSMRLIWPDEQPAFLRHAVNADALMESDFWWRRR